VVVEDTFLARNFQAAQKLGQARGIALLAAETKGLEAIEYTAKQIKSSVVGYGGADKEQVRQMVIRALEGFDLKGGMPSHHATDALACAICHLQSAKLRMAIMKDRQS